MHGLTTGADHNIRHAESRGLVQRLQACLTHDWQAWILQQSNVIWSLRAMRLVRSGTVLARQTGASMQ